MEGCMLVFLQNIFTKHVWRYFRNLDNVENEHMDMFLSVIVLVKLNLSKSDVTRDVSKMIYYTADPGLS